MAGTAADAISQAVERSKQLLFPVKIEKWFALGFTVFLAQCGEGGGSSSLPTNLPSRGTSPPFGGSGSVASGLQQAIQEALRALRADLALYVSLGVASLLAAVGVWLFVLWFSSRAKLMFVESVVWDRVDVSAQWTRSGTLGASLFKFRALLAGGALLLLLATFAGALAVGLPSFLSGNFWGPRAWAAYAIGTSSALLLGVPVAVIAALLDDFVVPLMVLRNVRVGDAWRACRAEVLAGNLGGVFLFYLLKMALGVAVAMITLVLTCVTCCLTAIPYLGTVLLLPVFVCFRAYSLCYLEQLGLSVFPVPEPNWASYNQWRFPR